MSFAYAAQGSEAEETESEEEKKVVEMGQEENIAKKRKIEGIEEDNIPEEREYGKTKNSKRNYTVLGRLSVPGTKRKYTVTQDELKRRIMAENMSNNMLRSLIRVCICYV